MSITPFPRNQEFFYQTPGPGSYCHHRIELGLVWGRARHRLRDVCGLKAPRSEGRTPIPRGGTSPRGSLKKSGTTYRLGRRDPLELLTVPTITVVAIANWIKTIEIGAAEGG